MKLIYDDYPEEIKDIKLKEVKEKRVGKGGIEHLLIEGENLYVLNAIQKEYKGKIGVIYIDPPYNTRRKKTYKDNRSHDKWLSFMAKRLELAKELLSDDGVIFISIDDNEQAQLKLLCDSIFGESNFVGGIIRNIPDGNNITKFSITHEYVLWFAKNKYSMFDINVKPKDNNPIESRLTKNGNSKSEIKFLKGMRAYSNITKKIKGDIGGKSEPITIIGEMVFKNGVLQKDVILEAEWAMPGVIKERLSGKRVIDKKGQEYLDIQFKDNGVPWIKKERLSGILRSVQEFKNETCVLEEIMGDRKIFNNPKPTPMIKQLVDLSPNKNSIILDFFAGSGTTFQAVAELNQEDGGNRKCILITNNENNICENITYQRCKKVVEGYTTPKEKQIPGTGGRLKYIKEIIK